MRLLLTTELIRNLKQIVGITASCYFALGANSGQLR